MKLRHASMVGTGVIGAGWAARLLYNGIDVTIYDPDPETERKVSEVCDNAERALQALIPEASHKPGSLAYADSLDNAVRDADLVIESVSERLDLKRSIHAQIDAVAPEDAVVTSSTSGIRPSEIQVGLKHPERMLVAHPFNPVYLLPLVELCGSPLTAPETVTKASQIFTGLGMRPLVVRQEIDGFIADRLMEALWREALWLVHDGVATTAEVDDAIRYGAGLRWAMMGTFQTFWLAGGEGGMRAMLEQFGPCLKWPWTKLMDVPELDDALIERISEQCDQQADGASPREMERTRDDGLVRILHALQDIDWGAGQTLNEYRSQFGGPKKA